VKYVGYFFLGLLGIIGVLVLSFALGWIAVPFQIFGVDNVKAQWQFAYTYDESLQAIARQDCTAITAVKAAATTDEATARRSQQFSIENNYSRVEGEYNAALRNAFQAKLVAPADVPSIAPTLLVMKQRVGCP
jgi:hypothetical protein